MMCEAVSPAGATMIGVSLLLSSLLHSSLSSSCCLTRLVEGSDELAGTYSLYTGAATFLPSCMSVCQCISVSVCQCVSVCQALLDN